MDLDLLLLFFKELGLITSSYHLQMITCIYHIIKNVSFPSRKYTESMAAD